MALEKDQFEKTIENIVRQYIKEKLRVEVWSTKAPGDGEERLWARLVLDGEVISTDFGVLN